MNIRKFVLENDYNEVSSWWKKQDWEPVAKELLSSDGFIVEDDKKISAAWVYSTNSPIYIMEWAVANPEVEWQKRKEGIELLIDYISNWSKNKGASALLTMTNSKRYIEKLTSKDFIKTDENMTHLLRSL